MAAEEVLDLLPDGVSNGEKGEDEMAAVGGDEVREGCGENVGPVTHCAAALVNEL